MNCKEEYKTIKESKTKNTYKLKKEDKKELLKHSIDGFISFETYIKVMNKILNNEQA